MIKYEKIGDKIFRNFINKDDENLNTTDLVCTVDKDDNMDFLPNMSRYRTPVKRHLKSIKEAEKNENEDIESMADTLLTEKESVSDTNTPVIEGKTTAPVEKTQKEKINEAREKYVKEQKKKKRLTNVDMNKYAEDVKASENKTMREKCLGNKFVGEAKTPKEVIEESPLGKALRLKKEGK